MHVLVIRSGPAAGERVDIAGELIVGRENADVVIPDEEMSRRHLAVRLVDGAVEIEDLGSTNGSFVHGRRIEAPILLDATTTLRIGETEIEIEIEPSQDAGATRVHQAPDAHATVIGREFSQTPSPQEARPPTPAPALAGDGAGAVPAFGELTPSRAGPRRSGVATRQAAPAVFTIALIVAVAVALVVYFGMR